MIQPPASELARMQATPLVDPFGRAITYLRVSVTDRCDLRCTYCMSEHMTFLPRRDLLTLEELDRLCSAFVARGTRKLRITGGEPLVRRDIMALFRACRAISLRRAARTDADHQRHAAGAARRGFGRRRREADQRVARHARSRQVSRDHPSRRLRQGHGRARCGAGGRPAGQDQYRRAQWHQRRRDRGSRALVARAGHGYHLHRGHAARRGVRPRSPIRFCPSRTFARRLAQSLQLIPDDVRTGGPARYDAVAETGRTHRLHHAADATISASPATASA